MIVPVEIKVNVSGPVDEALSALGDLRGKVEKRQVWFAEDRFGVAEGKLSLLDSGVIVRFRSGMGADDVTVKLRPCDEQQLVGDWSSGEIEEDSFKYRVEGDWTGGRHVLAASAVSSLPRGTLLDMVAPGVNAAAALVDSQQQFFDACARPGVHADRLRAFGPIAATKWSEMEFDGLEVNMERWTVADLDFVELSIRVSPKKQETAAEFERRATEKQRDLHQVLQHRQVAISQRRENKTQLVLAALTADHH